MNSEMAILNKLADKEYRDLFATEFVDNWIPFQIKALREQRGWTQSELGQRAAMPQEQISRLEDPNYCRFTLKTIKRLASAFDTALVVRFASFGEVAHVFATLSPKRYEVPSFDVDPVIHARREARPEYAQRKQVETVQVMIGLPVKNRLWSHELISCEGRNFEVLSAQRQPGGIPDAAISGSSR